MRGIFAEWGKGGVAGKERSGVVVLERLGVVAVELLESKTACAIRLLSEGPLDIDSITRVAALLLFGRAAVFH
jgi:hypothetical protein